MRIRKSVSTKVAGTHPAIPGGERAAVRFWGYLAGILLLGGIIYAFFGGWYWAPIGIALAFIVDAANSRSAQQFIASAAQRDPKFKSEMIAAGVILAE